MQEMNVRDCAVTGTNTEVILTQNSGLKPTTKKKHADIDHHSPSNFLLLTTVIGARMHLQTN